MENKNPVEINSDQAKILKKLRKHPIKFLDECVPDGYWELWHMDLIQFEQEYVPGTFRNENGTTYTDKNTRCYMTFFILSRGKTALENYRRADLTLKFTGWGFALSTIGFIFGVFVEYRAGIAEWFLNLLR